ncbi:DNA polymerase/3'-5' exonuclease PolX [Pedobacter boryungensis]|uniref:DNA polymerase/3'-5' exonuclease PolX n=1 Tax=Pedobacter boryungensis TaxID=869962 RepID=A0ABX2D8U9_9SPHI|nr:DNA polymerase/3'-5' exonuclease PolX [Pedobacter boryungensis]NQX30405.1 DNA polymerase/3'-5' exonuclease PolX [Pedobacter boryungensis]
MENKTISRTLRLFSQLMELNDENPFKIRSVANAAFKIDKLPFPIAKKPFEEIDKIDGIGKSIAAKIIELLETGTIQELESSLQQIPTGVVEMLSIKGIGAKKVGIIWHDLKIENVGELYYACNENRLIEAKGFGLKTQEEIKQKIEFRMAANGKFLYSHVEGIVNQLFTDLSVWLNKVDSRETLLGVAGEFRRYVEIVEEAKFIIGTDNITGLIEEIPSFELLKFENNGDNTFTAYTESGLQINLSIVQKPDFYLEYFKLTGNENHVNEVLKLAGSGPFKTEREIYEKAGLDFIEPELREGLNEIELAKKHQLPNLISYTDLKGSLHNHSDWSDGVHTLEEMALYCKEDLKLKYLGICDHSRSAFYAKGLNEQRVIAQHQQIEELNNKLAPFKIFKGIESDILNDGSLDYSDDILATFDFVVASVHSNLRMNEEKATARLIKAIENPYTTILGHPTGRLLLSRKGYEIDYKKVIDACAANKVVIEINANPLRLDLDWRWHHYALEKGVLLSVNPDAHRKEGFHDMRYGVMVARKGGLTAQKCLNAFSLTEITDYFNQKKISL